MSSQRGRRGRGRGSRYFSSPMQSRGVRRVELEDLNESGSTYSFLEGVGGGERDSTSVFDTSSTGDELRWDRVYRDPYEGEHLSWQVRDTDRREGLPSLDGEIERVRREGSFPCWEVTGGVKREREDSFQSWGARETATREEVSSSREFRGRSREEHNVFSRWDLRDSSRRGEEEIPSWELRGLSRKGEEKIPNWNLRGSSRRGEELPNWDLRGTSNRGEELPNWDLRGTSNRGELPNWDLRGTSNRKEEFPNWDLRGTSNRKEEFPNWNLRGSSRIEDELTNWDLRRSSRTERRECESSSSWGMTRREDAFSDRVLRERDESRQEEVQYNVFPDPFDTIAFPGSSLEMVENKWNSNNQEYFDASSLRGRQANEIDFDNHLDWDARESINQSPVVTFLQSCFNQQENNESTNFFENAAPLFQPETPVAQSHLGSVSLERRPDLEEKADRVTRVYLKDLREVGSRSRFEDDEIPRQQHHHKIRRSWADDERLGPSPETFNARSRIDTKFTKPHRTGSHTVASFSYHGQPQHPSSVRGRDKLSFVKREGVFDRYSNSVTDEPMEAYSFVSPDDFNIDMREVDDFNQSVCSESMLSTSGSSQVELFSSSDRIFRDPRETNKKREKRQKKISNTSNKNLELRQSHVRANQLLFIYFEQAILGFCGTGIPADQIRAKFQQLWIEFALDFFKRFWIMFGFTVDTESDFLPDKLLIDTSQSNDRTLKERFQQIEIRDPELQYIYHCKSNKRVSEVLLRDKFSAMLLKRLTPMLLESAYMENAVGLGLVEASSKDEMAIKCTVSVLHDFREKPGHCGVRLILRFEDEVSCTEFVDLRLKRYRFLSALFEKLGRKYVNYQIKHWLWKCCDFEKEKFNSSLKPLKRKHKGPQKWKKFRRKWRLAGRELTISDIVYGVDKLGDDHEDSDEDEDEALDMDSAPVNKHIRFFEETDEEAEEETKNKVIFENSQFRNVPPVSSTCSETSISAIVKEVMDALLKNLEQPEGTIANNNETTAEMDPNDVEFRCLEEVELESSSSESEEFDVVLLDEESTTSSSVGDNEKLNTNVLDLNEKNELITLDEKSESDADADTDTVTTVETVEFID